jgi:ribosomal-protein-alanine N-acetyltransferase
MTDATESITIGPMAVQEVAELERIDRESFPTPWPEAEFRRFIERDDAVAIAARSGERSVGYGVMLFEWDSAHVLKLVVDAPHRRRGIGRTLLDSLVKTASDSGAEKIVLEVRETNLAAQLFYRACGFRAIKIERSFYADTGEDAYAMERPLREVAATNGRGGSAKA